VEAEVNIVETEVVIAMSATTEEPEEEAPMQEDPEEVNIGGKNK